MLKLLDVIMNSDKEVYASTNHRDNASRLLHDLYKYQKYSDVTLVCSDQVTINAHKVVLLTAPLSFCCCLHVSVVKGTRC